MKNVKWSEIMKMKKIKQVTDSLFLFTRQEAQLQESVTPNYAFIVFTNNYCF